MISKEKTWASSLEDEAWRDLLKLRRLPWGSTTVRQRENQIIIRVTPGTLHVSHGAPLVRISIAHPDLGHRVMSGTGNSMRSAVSQLRLKLYECGVKLVEESDE